LIGGDELCPEYKKKMGGYEVGKVRGRKAGK